MQCNVKCFDWSRPSTLGDSLLEFLVLGFQMIAEISLQLGRESVPYFFDLFVAFRVEYVVIDKLVLGKTIAFRRCRINAKNGLH